MSALAACVALALGAAILLRLSGTRGLPILLAVVALSAGGVAFSILSKERVATARSSAAQNPISFAADRHAFTGRFTRGERWLGMADALASRGNRADAAGVLVAAVRQHPRDYALWTGLGTMLSEHGGLNPGARLAFERAIDLAPTYPAPRYFLGLAEARSGNLAEARQLWTAVLAEAPANASWRPMVEDRLAASAPPVGPASD